MTSIRIADRAVGDGHACFVIAEAGVNHNGDAELAHKLVDVAAQSGVDAVKFQKRSPKHILTVEALDRPYANPNSFGSTYGEHRERLELGDDDYAELMRHCHEVGLIFLASAWDEPSADFLERLGVPAFKVASADLTNQPLLDHIARKGRPMFLSTGMSEIDEIGDAVDTVRRHVDEIVLLQCTSTYPADNAELNLRVIPMLRERFRTLVGYSGHERGLSPSEVSVALGACVVERHFTLDRTMAGPDHAASLEPHGLELLVRNLRNIEDALGTPEKTVLASERPTRERLAKSLVASADIPAGTRIERSMLTAKSPGTGISPRHIERLEGAVAKSDIPADTLLPLEALDWR